MNKKINWKSGSFKCITFLLLIGCLLAIHVFAPGVTENLCHLARGGNLKETTDYLRSFGPWAIVVSFFLDVLINALGFLPSIFYQRQMVLSLVCLLGLLYPGWPKPSVWCLIFCASLFLRDEAEKLITKSNNLKRLDEMSSKGGLTAMALARTLPYFPSGILTALGAVSRMSARDYIIANLIGKFPSTALEVVVGHDVVNFRAHMDRLAVLTTLVIIVYGGLLYHRKRKEKKSS